MARLRASTSSYLSKKGYNQNEIADFLQVSQPVVSGYLSKAKQLDYSSKISKVADEIGIKIGESFHTYGKDALPKVLSLGCNMCKTLRQGGLTCQLHRKKISGLEDNCSRCLTQDHLIELQSNRQFILTQLNDFLAKMIRHKSFANLIPEIGMQIVFSIDEPHSTGEIAAFPGRIIKRRKEIPLSEPAAFGSSETLSNLLLMIQKFNPKIKTIAAVKTSEWLLDRLVDRKIKFIKTQEFDKNKNAFFNKHNQTLTQLKSEAIIILDEGAIGFEAISYIIGWDLSFLDKVFSKMLQSKATLN